VERNAGTAQNGRPPADSRQLIRVTESPFSQEDLYAPITTQATVLGVLGIEGKQMRFTKKLGAFRLPALVIALSIDSAAN
jgi:hypothetical protein